MQERHRRVSEGRLVALDLTGRLTEARRDGGRRSQDARRFCPHETRGWTVKCRLPLLVLLLAGAAAAGCGADLGDSASTGKGAKARHEKIPLRFKVTPSKRRYVLGEQVRLALTLKLSRRARSAVTVTTYPDGTVHVVSVKRRRKGKVRTLHPHRTAIDFEEDPLLLRTEALKRLAPGKHLKIPYDVELDGDKGVLLSDVQLHGNQQHIALVYPLTGPGLYTVRLSYKYTGRSGGKSGVFRGRLLSKKVRFRIVR